MRSQKSELPTPHTSLNRWYASAPLVEGLKEVVSTEPFKVAVAVLKNATKPSFKSISSSSTEDNAARFAWYAGYCDALDDLEKLSKAPLGKSGQEAEEWTHIEI